MATTAQYTIIEDTRTSLIIKLTKKDSNFSYYRLFFYPGATGGTAIKDYNYSSSELENGLRFTGLTEGQTYRIDLGANNNSTSTQPSIADGNRIGTTIFQKSIMTYQLQFYYQQNEKFLPITTIERSYDDSSWTTIDFDKTSTAGVTIDDTLAIDKAIYIRITKEANTTVTGWYVATNGTTRSSYSTDGDTVTYKYEYDSDDYVTQVNMRAVFQTYHFRINYNDTPYISWGGPNKASLIVAINNGFKKILTYTFDYPEYQSGTIGGWSTTQNGTLEYYGGQEYELVGEDGVSQTIINVYKAYKNLPYRIKLSLYKNDGSSSSPFETFEFGREDSSTIQLTQSEILEIKQVSPERSGYEFLGYSTSTTATTATYKFAGSGAANSWSFTGTSSTRNYNLYAVWRIWYEASFTLYANGGQFSDDSTSTTYSEGSSLSNKIVFVPQPTRDGYAFLGWATTSSATTTSYGTQGPFDLAQFGKNYTLYAVWQRVYHYKVTYKSGAGKWSNGDTELIDEADTPNIRHWYSLTSNTPISNTTDYVFRAWSDGYNDFPLPTGLYLEFSDTKDSIELTYTAKYGKATEDGVVYINGEPYIPYIYSTINGVADWRQYEAHIYSSGWKISIE